MTQTTITTDALIEVKDQLFKEFPPRVFIFNDGRVVFSSELTDESPNVAATYVLETVNRG